MLLKPRPLGESQLDISKLTADKKSCRKIGPCGIGQKALYLNSFYIDRCYYVPIASVTRVFKRVAMSKGGFSGKGAFVSIAYLVVEYDHGQQKQCIFKHEKQVDQFLALLAQEQPQIKLVSQRTDGNLSQGLSKLSCSCQICSPHRSETHAAGDCTGSCI